MSHFKQLLQREADTILNMPIHEGDFFMASSIIYSAVHENDKKVVCSGMGKAGQIANIILQLHYLLQVHLLFFFIQVKHSMGDLEICGAVSIINS